MNIAHIVSTFPPYRGGMGNATEGMARALAARDHDVHVYTVRDHEPKAIVEPENIVVSPLRPWVRLGNAALLPQLLWENSGCDIVHLHVPFFGGAEFVALWKRYTLLRTAPLVVTYHMDAVSDGFKGKFFRWYNRAIMSRILGSADRIIVTSRDYAEHSLLATLPSLQEKIVEIPLGVDTDRFSPSVHVPQPPSYPTILFVGTLDAAHAFKGVDVLLRAIKFVSQFQDLKLILVGDGNRRKHFEELAEGLGVNDRVLFAGSASDGQLPEHYTRADALVLPSVSPSEAFGMVLLEAMASGTPVIASNLPGVRTVVQDGVTGVLVRPGDIIGLGKAITELLHDTKRRQAMGKAARKHVEEKYQWKYIGEQLEHLYTSIL